MQIFIIIIACLLIMLFLIQEGKTEGFLNTTQDFKNVKERGPGKFLSIATGILSALFVILSFVKGL